MHLYHVGNLCTFAYIFLAGIYALFFKFAADGMLSDIPDKGEGPTFIRYLAIFITSLFLMLITAMAALFGWVIFLIPTAF